MAAERWDTPPEEPETLVQQMDRWAGEMATMSEGAPGYASWAGYEAYVAGMRASETGLPPRETVDRQETLRGGENTTLAGVRIVQSVASRLGLSRK